MIIHLKSAHMHMQHMHKGGPHNTRLFPPSSLFKSSPAHGMGMGMGGIIANQTTWW